jgi:hypothetical protein
MSGNVLLAILTLMVAMLLLAPAILGSGQRREARKKSAAAAAGPGGHAPAVAHPHPRLRGLPLRQVSRSQNSRTGLRRS